jgi:serine/threonine-protein kinase RsbW
MAAELKVPADLAYISVVLAFVREMADLAELDEKARGKIELAVEEAASNVVRHAYVEDEGATYRVTCRPLVHGLEVRIRHHGLPYEAEKDPGFTPIESPDDDVEGLGTFLIRAMVDELEYINGGEHESEVRLIKYR